MTRANLHEARYAAHFPFVVLPAGGFFAPIGFEADTRAFEHFADAFHRFSDGGFFLYLAPDGYDYHLNRGDAGRHNQPCVIAVRHNQATDEASTCSPANRGAIFTLPVRVK